MLTESCVMFFSPSLAVLSAILRHGITKDRCSDFNQQRPPLTESGLPVT